MAKLWQNSLHGDNNKLLEKLNNSISFDSRLYREDIDGSIAHVKMLAKCGIIPESDSATLVQELKKLLAALDSGEKKIDLNCEDIHTFVENEIVASCGKLGLKIHTARSRNDQVALDLRLYLKEVINSTMDKIRAVIETLCDNAKKYIDVIMPGFTHLQHAQPILYSHYLLAYANMFFRDMDRFDFALNQADISPIGACALAGTTFDTDRFYEAKELGILSVNGNSIDAVSDRDFGLDYLYAASVLTLHMSRMAEEIVIFNSQEYSYISIGDAWTTGSSIMPQKKNPDVAELLRAKTGRTIGNLNTLLIVLKGLPLAYSKDLQEDKEAIFDSVDTLELCLDAFLGMIKDIVPNRENMLQSCKKGFITATEIADYLTKRGLPFREAYRITADIVRHCKEKNLTLDALSFADYKKFSPLFEKDVFDAIDIVNCVNKKNSYGGTSRESVLRQIEEISKILK